GVLVVDDDDAARQALLVALDGAGYRVTGADSGEAALAALDRDPSAYGLVVLDLGLPGLDGFGVLEAIRTRPATRALPVLVVTGRDLDAAEKSRLAARAVEVLRKSDDIGVPLAEAVARALGGTPGSHLVADTGIETEGTST